MKNWRIHLIFTFLFLFGIVIICRLVYLQIIDYKIYRAQALGQQIRLKEVEGLRGEILFKDGIKSLAINKEEWRVYALPKEITDKNNVSEVLGNILSESPKIISSKIEDTDCFSVIKNQLTEEEIKNVKDSNLNGIYLEKLSQRYYPQKTLSSQVAGFLGGNGDGQYGLEGYYDEILKGKKGFKEEETKGLIFFDSEGVEAAKDGSNLYLTIDYNIQFIAESLLQEAKDTLDIESGQIIVLEPNSGKVIALANFPNFNLNEYSKEKDLSIFQNGAVQKLFEPGSVFKPITIAIALNEGKITPDTTYIDKGYVKIGNETIDNYDKRVYGETSMTQVLEKSINTGAIYAQKSVDRDVYLKYLDKFGFNEQTGIDLQGEAYSSNENLNKGGEINLATSSFGQGIEMTPLQLARAFCVIANGGKLVKPYIVEKTINEKGEETETLPQISKEGIITSQTITQLTTMLINVIENGYGTRAKVPGYYVAGKTGTAQVPIEGKRGYDPNKTIQSFIGFSPALNPRFLILVKLDNPKAKTAEYSATPIFGKLAKYIIDYWQIPPDYE